MGRPSAIAAPAGERHKAGTAIPTYLVVNIGLLIILIWAQVTPAWSLVLAVWLNSVVFCLRSPERRSYLLGFLIAFFVFLMGRVTVSEVFGFEPDIFTQSSFQHLVVSLLLALMFIMIGYGAAGRISRSRRESGKFRLGTPTQEASRTRLRGAALILFWCTVPAAYLAGYHQLSLARSGGYVGLHDASTGVARAVGAWGYVGQVGLVSTVAFALYLATFPRLRDALPVLIAWVVPLLFILASGQRTSFVTGLLFIWCYSLARRRITPSDPWLTRRATIGTLAAAPALLLLLVQVEAWRGHGRGAGGSVWDSLLSFFHGQGVSARTVTNSFEYARLIPEQPYALEFLRYGILGRVLGFAQFPGNSVEKAQEGWSFAHSLSYAMLGEERYLSGMGTGSSFIAEAYFVGGYFLVAAFALGYGMLARFLDNLGHHSYTLDAVALVIAQDVFFAPRSSATQFLSTLLAPSTILGVLAVLAIAAVGRKTRRSTRPRVRPAEVAEPGGTNQSSTFEGLEGIAEGNSELATAARTLTPDVRVTRGPRGQRGDLAWMKTDLGGC